MSVRKIIRDIIEARADAGESTSPAHVESIVRQDHAEVFVEFGIELSHI